ncbi:universal stress protein [Sphingobium yanoikuyae]|uniref:universal stress protein n=1 Tax=Sphingobium TaxID=165695 RepID=UPI000847A011
MVEVPAEGRDAGVALQAYREKTKGDLLVMGAFGHSRAREFVLGGATRSVLDHPSCPVLLSH